MKKYVSKSTGNLLERQPKQFYFRKRYFSGLVDVKSNALYDDPEDSFMAAVFGTYDNVFVREILMIECDLTGELQRVRLEPNDILVLSIDAVLSKEQKTHILEILELFQEKFPTRSVLVLDHGMKLSVISEEEIGTVV